MTAASAVTLTCPECRHENEIERIYCHSCGARLDRSAVSARKMPKTEAPEQVHKRLRGMFDQRKARIRSFVLNGLKLMLAAGVAATVAQILMSPGVPPAKKSDSFPPQINMDLEMMTQYRRPPWLRYSEEAVNGFIGNALKNKKEKLNHPLIDFKRAILSFGEGSFHVTVERSIFGYSIYTAGIYAAGGDGKTISAAGGSIGRLPIHPALMKYAGFLFGDIANALQQQTKQIARVGSIEFHDKEIVFNAPR
jgi:transcription initiation factor TFIIIB Brf1 subunit/transcription initiation factor TFIIB